MKSILGTRALVLTRADSLGNYDQLYKLHLLVVTQLLPVNNFYRDGSTHKIVLRDQHGKLFFKRFDRFEKLNDDHDLQTVAEIELSCAREFTYAPNGLKNIDENINSVDYLRALPCGSKGIKKIWLHTELFDNAYKNNTEMTYDVDKDVARMAVKGLPFDGGLWQDRPLWSL